MNKLLTAGFCRLRIGGLFWITAAAVIILSSCAAYGSAVSYRTQLAEGWIGSLDDYFFALAPYTGAVYAIFISLFLGTEHSDGALRNKLIAGHTRLAVYMSNYLVCLTASLCFLALWLLCQTPSFFTIGPFTSGISGQLACIAVAIGFTASLTAIFVLVATFTTNKALSVVFVLLLWFVLIMAGSMLWNRLDAPEIYYNVLGYADGEFVLQDEVLNPDYIGGTARVILKYVRDILPTGQQMQVYNASVEYPAQDLLLSAALTILMLFTGIHFFRKKDLK